MIWLLRYSKKTVLRLILPVFRLGWGSCQNMKGFRLIRPARRLTMMSLMPIFMNPLHLPCLTLNWAVTMTLLTALQLRVLIICLGPRLKYCFQNSPIQSSWRSDPAIFNCLWSWRNFYQNFCAKLMWYMLIGYLSTYLLTYTYHKYTYTYLPIPIPILIPIPTYLPTYLPTYQ